MYLHVFVFIYVYRHIYVRHVLAVALAMYVCIEVALRGDAHGIGRSNWAKGRDPTGLWVQYPNPAVPSAPRHSSWNILVHFRALSGPTLLWAAKGVLCPHVGGTETHRAHVFYGYSSSGLFG